MIRLDEVRARVEAKVTVLAGRLGNAGDFAQVVENNQLPQVTPAGYVLPSGLSGGKAEASAGIFKQNLVETVMVVIALRVAGDPLAAAGIDEVKPIVTDVVNAVAGWGPDDCPGIFVLVRGELVGAVKGVLIYQLEFAIDDQLRITP